MVLGRREARAAARGLSSSATRPSGTPVPRAELLHVLTLPDYDRAGRIGDFYANPVTRSFAELLIDAEEDPYLRAVLVGMLRGEPLMRPNTATDRRRV